MRSTLVPFSLLAALTVGVNACTEDLVSLTIPDTPTGLTYELEPSGTPSEPRGIVLRWDAVDDGGLEGYVVYSRGTDGGTWGRRGSTTSLSFHDDGIPHLQYYVTAVNVSGGESDPSDYVEVDERLRLPTPASLTSISLDGAIHLSWADNAFQAEPAGFAHYRVYSTAYDLDANRCGSDWSLEGSTVAPTFLVAAITNGRPLCFGVSAISIEGFESLWSPLRYDTPRPNGRNVILFTQPGDATRSSFRFFQDLNSDGLVARTELGIVGPGTSATADLIITDVGGTLFLTPVRAATDLRTYGTTPIADLTDVDIAPAAGYARTAPQAAPLWGYVFRMNEGDGFYRYGALRVSAVGSNYVIFDWAYQTDPGNPELVRVR